MTSYGTTEQLQLSFIRRLRVARSTEISFLLAIAPFCVSRNGGEDSGKCIAKRSEP